MGAGEAGQPRGLKSPNLPVKHGEGPFDRRVDNDLPG